MRTSKTPAINYNQSLRYTTLSNNHVQIHINPPNVNNNFNKLDSVIKPYQRPSSIEIKQALYIKDGQQNNSKIIYKNNQGKYQQSRFKQQNILANNRIHGQNQNNQQIDDTNNNINDNNKDNHKQNINNNNNYKYNSSSKQSHLTINSNPRFNCQGCILM